MRRGRYSRFSMFGRWRVRLVAGAGEDRLSGVLRGDGVVAAEEVELALAAVDVAGERAGGAEGRCSIGHRGGGWLLAGLESGCVRICSFLPSATEIIAELGLIDSLVGVSEECRWPPEVIGKPVVTAARIDPSSMSSLEIDEAVRASVRDGRSLYTVDAELIEALAPDLIVTQDLCAVCAVSSGELASACPVDAEVLSLDPRTLREVAESVRVLGSRLGVAERGEEMRRRMLGDDRELAASVRGLPQAPGVLRGVDRAAVLCRALAAGDDRARRRRRRPRRAGRAVASDELGRGASRWSPSS